MSGTNRQLILKSQNFFSAIDKRSGIYFITPRHYFEGVHKDVDEKMLVKIGLASDLYHRLNSYLLYWPEGFYVLGIIFTSNKKNAKRTESSIHSYLNRKSKYFISANSKDEEWFEISKAEIEKVIKLVQSNKKMKYPSDYTVKALRNKNVFLITDVAYVSTYILIIANKEVGQHRIKKMSSILKRELDRNLLSTYNKTIITDKKPKKLTKLHPRRRKNVSWHNRLFEV